MGRTTKISITEGDLNFPCGNWNGQVEKSRTTQVFLNRLVWEKVYTQVVNNPTRGNDFHDVYLVWPESAFTPCSNVQEISYHCEVLLEI